MVKLKGLKRVSLLFKKRSLNSNGVDTNACKSGTFPGQKESLMDSGKWIVLLVGLVVILIVSALAIRVAPIVKRRIQQWSRENIVDTRVDQQLSELELMHQGYTIWPSDASEEQKDQALDDLRTGKPYQFYPLKQAGQEQEEN